MQAVQSNKAPEAIGPYSQAIRSGNTLYLSGQIGIDPETGKLVSSELEAQTRRIFQNISAILESEGLDLSSVIKCSIFLTDMDDFREVNTIYAEHFSPPYPARETVAVKGLPAGARIEISAMAEI